MDLIRICTATLQSFSPYSQSRMHETPKAYEKETGDEYERRTWREKATVNDDGIVCIPGMAFKQALDKAATRLSMKVTGKGKGTYTKHFAGGVLLPDFIPLGISKDELLEQRLYVNSDGIRGSGKRVWRHFPYIKTWQADVPFTIIDAQIGKDTFQRHLLESGHFVGVGRFRPEKGGTNGRFKIVKMEWTEQTIEQALAA